MPESADPAASVGFLIAAGAATLLALVGYGVVLARRLMAVATQNARLKAGEQPSASAAGEEQ